MPINFVPNDAKAGPDAPAMRLITPRPDRPASQAGFAPSPAMPAQAAFPPGTLQFVQWQSREAALAALDAWQSVTGAALAKWPRVTPKRLPLKADAGQDLNAFYDGHSLSFFHFPLPGGAVFSGSSTDVVAHECGHGLLDSVRPQLFTVNFTETGAFHEAFGDIMALVTALHDKESRDKLLAKTPDLSKNNFLETTAEELSDAVRRAFGASHPAAKPRQACNKFQWQLPTTLPTSAPPDVLTSEIHSFARVFTGCYYDALRNIFVAQPTHNEATLLKTTILLTKLVIAGAKNAPLNQRFFRAVGRGMVLEDQASNAGANKAAIEKAFNDHGILLGAASILAPSAELEGSAPKKAALLPTTRKDLLERINAPKGAKLLVDELALGAEKFAHAVHERLIGLGDVHKSLKGVVALGTEAIAVGAAAGRAAILGSVPDETSVADEVKHFVETLLKNGNIQLDGPAPVASAVAGTAGLPTHVVRKKGKHKVLERVRFACPGVK